MCLFIYALFINTASISDYVGLSSSAVSERISVKDVKRCRGLFQL
jgi:hypothetical protein